MKIIGTSKHNEHQSCTLYILHIHNKLNVIQSIYLQLNATTQITNVKSLIKHRRSMLLKYYCIIIIFVYANVYRQYFPLKIKVHTLPYAVWKVWHLYILVSDFNTYKLKNKIKKRIFHNKKIIFLNNIPVTKLFKLTNQSLT